MTRLDDVPTTGEMPEGATPSDVVARIRAYRPSRRVVLRGLLIAAAASALVPLDWYLTRRTARAAPATAVDASRSEFGACKPASYDEEANNWWTDTSPPAVCYGGWRRGSFPCASDHWHREGKYTGRGESYTSTRMTTNCHGRNAWRWKGYRCSDAMTTATFDDGSEYNALTIAACVLPADIAAAPADDDPRYAPDDGGGQTDSENRGGSGGGTGRFTGGLLGR
ncbi:hypothetical protein GCM10009836_05500 [Pseudonocardia ailaonensis]|uniref:DUF3761 domain-containing protein n=1 Tax=Pseudonocardia ailaonensis TaxID=367279 RepID=A0ABN2MKE5_9PSEU